MKNNKGLFLSLIFSLSIISTVIIGFYEVEEDIDSTEVERLESSLKDAAVHCYSIEGFYPADIDYLIDNYGVVVDFKEFNIYYATIGSNILPEIEVFRKGGN